MSLEHSRETDRPTNRPRRRTGLIVSAVVVVLLALSASGAWYFLVPMALNRVLESVQSGLQRITGAQVTIAAARLPEMGTVALDDLVVTVEGKTLAVVPRIQIAFDPLSFEEGLPRVTGIDVEKLSVTAWRNLEGQDNVLPVLASLQAYLERERTGTGPATLFARILRQTPPIHLTDVSMILVREDSPGAPLVREFELAQGELSMVNPGVTLWERGYVVQARASEVLQKCQISGDFDVNIDDRSLQGFLRFEPPFTLKQSGNSAQVKEVKVKTGEFAEILLGRIEIQNPLEGPQDVPILIEKLLTRLGRTDARAIADQIDPDGLVDRFSKMAATRLVQLNYDPSIWERFDRDARIWISDLFKAALADTAQKVIVLDGAHFLLSSGVNASGYTEDRVKVRIDKDGAPLGNFAYWRNHGNDYTKVSVDFLAPSGVFKIKGEGVQDGKSLRFVSDIQVSLEQPFVQLSGSVSYDAGLWEGQVQGQVKSTQPPLAVSVNVLTRSGQWKGTVDASGAVPGLLVAKEVHATVDGSQWTGEVEGSVVFPGGQGQLDLSLLADSQSGVKRLSFESPEDIAVPITGQVDLLVRKGRIGRDGVVHLESLALVKKGAARSRAILSMTDLALQLTSTGNELLQKLSEADPDGDIEVLIGQLVRRIEIVEPVLILRQPPRLTSNTESDKPKEDDSYVEKLEDNLEERAPGKSPMNEGLRKGMSRLVTATTRQVERLVTTLVKLGDRFPVEEVVVREGRFEYSDAVSAQDRLLTDLSNFNAQISKVSKPGSFGQKFTVSAWFSTPVGERQARSRLDAEVDLATGNLTGQLEVEKMALYPYRFFLPALVAPSPVSRLENTLLKFQYLSEGGVFDVWGKGELRDFNVVSRRISERPIEHLNLDVALGVDAESGLRFDVPGQKMSTASPVLVSMGKTQGLAVRLSIDASLSDWPKFVLDVALPDTPVMDLLASWPAPMVSDIRDLSVDGNLGFSLHAAGDSRDLSDMEFSFIGRDEGVRVTGGGRKVDLQRLTTSFQHRPPTAPQRRISVGSGRKYVPLDRISPWMVLAVATTEDGSFFRHEGFNTYQIRLSVIRNLEAGRFVRGASTITMQLMKNLFLSHEKTVARKFQEILLTWLVEKEVPKERLIEIYLNIIEWGDGIYGIQEACDYYFDGLPPASLSPMQAAFLASFIPYPRPFHHRFEQGMKNGKRDSSFERWWGKRLKIVGRIVKAMVDNCSMIDRKCPSRVRFCGYLQRLCTDSRSEFHPMDSMTSLDEIFRLDLDSPMGDDEPGDAEPVEQEL